MTFLATAVIIAIASSGLASQDQPQTPVQRFAAAQSQLDKYLAALQPKEAIVLLESIIPSEVPEVQSDPQDPNILIRSLTELGFYQNMYAYLGRAQVLSGDIEKSLESFQKAQSIAETKAKGTEDLVNSQIEGWTQAIEHAKNRLKDIETLIKTKTDLEAKSKKSSEEKKTLKALQDNMLGLEYEANVCRENINKGPLAIEQMNNILKTEREDSGRFALVISGLQETLKNERDLITSNFGGDKAKYVASVVNTKENLENQKTQQDKMSFLNRLLHLDPANKDVQEQLALVIGNA